MPRKVNLNLTILEATAIIKALSNTTDWEDVMQSLFPVGNERATCYRAVKKIQEALWRSRKM